jgi:TRAP-type mannitol/chloroaromatic compound transport system permease small subunit
MKTVVRFIDAISERTGRTAHWLCAILVLFMVVAVIMRYVFGASTLWAYEVGLMMGATIYAMAMPYVHKHSGHVRVDVFYHRLSPRRKAIIDIIGFLLFFIPLMLLLVSLSVGWAWKAWAINEKMYETGWYPPAAPLRTAVAYGICLFALQGLAHFIRDLYLVIRNKPL